MRKSITGAIIIVSLMGAVSCSRAGGDETTVKNSVISVNNKAEVKEINVGENIGDKAKNFKDEESSYQESAGEECEKAVDNEVLVTEEDKIDDIIRGREYESFKKEVLFLLGNTVQDVKGVFGEPTTTGAGEGTEVMIYQEKGIIFGHVMEMEEILVVRPYKDTAFFGIARGMDISRVREVFGNVDYIMDYAEGEGRIALQYLVDDYNIRVIFYNARVADIAVTKNDSGKNISAIDPIKDEGFKDKVTNEVVGENEIIGMLKEEEKYIREHLGVYEGVSMGETIYREKYTYIYRDLGVTYIKDLKSKFMNSVMIFNREIFGIKAGMDMNQVITELGVPGKKGAINESGENSLYSMSYRKKVEDTEYDFNVYLDRDKGSVYFTELSIAK